MEINLKLSVFNDENESDSLVKVNIENLKDEKFTFQQAEG